MSKYGHRHRTKSSREIPWTRCVTPDLCAATPARQAAHGNIIREDRCACGAVRRTEVNQTVSNSQSWAAVGR